MNAKTSKKHYLRYLPYSIKGDGLNLVDLTSPSFNAGTRNGDVGLRSYSGFVSNNIRSPRFCLPLPWRPSSRCGLRALNTTSQCVRTHHRRIICAIYVYGRIFSDPRPVQHRRSFEVKSLNLIGPRPNRFAFRRIVIVNSRDFYSAHKSEVAGISLFTGACMGVRRNFFRGEQKFCVGKNLTLFTKQNC